MDAGVRALGSGRRYLLVEFRTYSINSLAPIANRELFFSIAAPPEPTCEWASALVQSVMGGTKLCQFNWCSRKFRHSKPDRHISTKAPRLSTVPCGLPNNGQSPEHFLYNFPPCIWLSQKYLNLQIACGS